VEVEVGGGGGEGGVGDVIVSGTAHTPAKNWALLSRPYADGLLYSNADCAYIYNLSA
jgi:hypothetical protein